MDKPPAEPRTFHATPAAWLGQLSLPLLFCGLLALTAVRALGMSLLLAGAGVGAVCLVAWVDYLLPMLRNWLSLDARTISGSLNGQEFEFYWTEIIAAWLFEYRRRRFLCLGTREGSLMVPLRFFDHQAVWALVRASVMPEALREDALRKLPDYQEWVRTREQALQTAGPTTVSDHWLIQMVGWVGLTGFIFELVQAVRAGQLHLAALFILLTAGSVVLLLSWGVTEISAERIQRHTLTGGWSLSWEQIRAVEIDPRDTVLVLVTDDHEMVIPGPGVWYGPRREAMALLLSQIEQRGIPLRRNPQAVIKFSRKIRSGKTRAGKTRARK